MSFLFYLLLFIFLFICVVLSGSILVQESKSSGLASLLVTDSSDSLFGTATADVIKKVTAYLAIIFMAGCIFLSIWTSALNRINTTSHPVNIEHVQE